MAELDKISIIMVTCNNVEMTKTCIALIESYVNANTYEMIVVDNGSSDDTCKYLMAKPNIHVIYNKCNGGMAKAWNRAAAVAKGEWLLFLHNDIFLTPNTVVRLLEVMGAKENIAVVGPYLNRGKYRTQICSMPGNTFEDVVCYAESIEADNYNKCQGQIVDSACFLTRKTVYDELGGFTEEYDIEGYEDADYCLRAIRAGYEVWYANTFVFHNMGSFLCNGKDRESILHQNELLFRERWGFRLYYSMFKRTELLECIEYDEHTSLNILEIGCAAGGTMVGIKQRVPHANIYGVEIDENAAEIAKYFGTVIAADIEKYLPKEYNEKFDYIIMGDVLEHLRDPWSAIANIKLMLKKNGKLIISIPNVLHISIFEQMFSGEWEYEDAGIMDRTHLRFFTAKSIRKLIEDNGMSIVNMDGVYVQLPNKYNAMIDGLLSSGWMSVGKSELMAYQYIIVAEKVLSYCNSTLK